MNKENNLKILLNALLNEQNVSPAWHNNVKLGKQFLFINILNMYFVFVISPK